MQKKGKQTIMKKREIGNNTMKKWEIDNKTKKKKYTIME